MEITGRLTADAVVRTVSGERKVVGFSIAINDSYRSGGEQKKITTFFDCSYWLNTGIAGYLKKGGWVQLYGRVGTNAYINGSGEAKASLTFHTSEVKLLGTAAQSAASSNGNETALIDLGKQERTADRTGQVEIAQAERTGVENTNTFEGIDGDIPF